MRVYERETVPILARGVVVAPNGSVIRAVAIGPWAARARSKRCRSGPRGPPFPPVLQSGTGGPPYAIPVMLKMTKLSK